MLGLAGQALTVKYSMSAPVLSSLATVGHLVLLILQPIEAIVSWLVGAYDRYYYDPINIRLTPLVRRLPRYYTVNGVRYTIFTANVVSCGRVGLVVFTVCALKFHWNVTAFFLVLLHEFFDDVDGIVARAQRELYGQIDDPVLGGFLDAFCDKIFNITCLWSLLMVVDLTEMSTSQVLVFVVSMMVIIFYEIALGVVRVQDYFFSYYSRHYGDTQGAGRVKISANMAGKLKMMLETLGLAFLCSASASANLMYRVDGVAGVACLLLAVRLAHESLMHKLRGRLPNRHTLSESTPSDSSEIQSLSSKAPLQTVDVFLMMAGDDVMSERNLAAVGQDTILDKVFTIGCFDDFNGTHENVLKSLRQFGKKVIVGVYDDISVQKLKDTPPLNCLEKRMENVYNFADIVFCVSSSDPTFFLQCSFDKGDGQKAFFVCCDKISNFPEGCVRCHVGWLQLLPCPVKSLAKAGSFQLNGDETGGERASNGNISSGDMDDKSISNGHVAGGHVSNGHVQCADGLAVYQR